MVGMRSVGMFVYILEISKDARCRFSFHVNSLRSFIRCVVFLC